MNELTKGREELLEHFQETRGCLDECVYGDCIPCAKIRALIESGVPAERKGDSIFSHVPAPRSSTRFLASVTSGQGPQYDAAPSPAPLPAEAEEAMDNLSGLVNWAIIGRAKCHPDIPFFNERLEQEWRDSLAVIKAALRPRVVSREWVEETAATLRCVKWHSIDDQNEWLSKRLRELGYEVVG